MEIRYPSKTREGTYAQRQGRPQCSKSEQSLDLGDYQEPKCRASERKDRFKALGPRKLE